MVTSSFRISVDLADSLRGPSPFIIAVNRFVLDSLLIHHSRLNGALCCACIANYRIGNISINISLR